jgi:hypothetical protein
MIPLLGHRTYEFIARPDLIRPRQVIRLDGHMLGSSGPLIIIATGDPDATSVAWHHDRPVLHVSRCGRVGREVSLFATRLFQVPSSAIASVGWLVHSEAKVWFPELLDGLTQAVTPAPMKDLATNFAKIINDVGGRDPMVTLASGHFTEVYPTTPDQRTPQQVAQLEARLRTTAGHRVRVISATSELGRRTLTEEGFPHAESAPTESELNEMERCE